MDFSSTIEDPRHTPGKRHGYAKEQCQAFTNNNQKSLLSSFITTPPVVKPQNYFTGCNISDANKFYQNKEQKQERSNSTPFFPSQKSAFLAYRSSPNRKQPEMKTDPPSIIGDALIVNNGILRPKPRYVTSISQSYNKNVTKLGCMQYPENNNNGAAQIMVVDRNINRQEGTTSQQLSTKMIYSEVGSRKSPMIEEKKVEDLPRLKNFKNILNKFQMASDRALREQQQREQIRYNANDHESDQEFNIPDWEQSTEFAYSEQDYKLTKIKRQHLRPFTISVPNAGKNIRNSLPKQWIMQINDAHVDVDVEPRSPTISATASIPPSSPILSSDRPPNRTNSLRLVNAKHRTFFNNCSHRNEPMMRQLRYSQNVSRSRPILENEEKKSLTGISASSQDCTIRCTSAECYKRLIPVVHISTHSPSLPRSESQSVGSETEDDDDSASVVGLYKQMTSNHLEILEYASTHWTKFFTNRNLIVSKTNLQKLKLDDLIFESMMPIFSKCSTHFFNAFLPHDGFLSSAINVIAEPVFIHSTPIKPNLSVGNIWDPPILVEIKAKRDEEQRILRGILRHRSNQKYRFLIIPRYNLLTFKSFAANHQHVQDVSEEYEQKVCFILLQLVWALKSFQLNGIEAVSDDLSEFILLCKYTRTNHKKIGSMDHLPRILLLQESLITTNKKSIIGLCDYGLKILSTMLNLNRNSLTSLTSSIQECAKALQQDKCSSLTEAKNALEFGMFVGHDVSSFGDEEDVQAWIDSKRADYANYLFREVAGGSCSLNEVYERLRLQFLLSVTPRTLLKMLENMNPSKF